LSVNPAFLAGSVIRWAGVVALNYHRIGDGRRSIFDRGLWSATAEDFDAQARWLKANFDVIGPGDLAHVSRLKRGRHIVITFDDGYADNFTTAYPILRAHGLPATFFIATGYIDEPRLPWWDQIAWMVRASKRASLELPGHLSAPLVYDEPERDVAVRVLLHMYRTLPADRTVDFVDAIADATGSGHYGGAEEERLWMTWDMLREMTAGGMTIGGHTVTHRILARMSREEQRREIEDCGRRIAEELGIAMRTFSYPVGLRDCFDSDTIDCLRKAGVETAFSYYGGFRRFRDWDRFDIPRNPIEQYMTFMDFKAVVMSPTLARLYRRIRARATRSFA
jgi:peptidoglycan/xylan/chitin deacetylase (PgdA/CDA1 family)